MKCERDLLIETILIIGGYGVFGGNLAQRLVREGMFRILVAGRSLSKAKAFCDRHGGEPVFLDTNDDLLDERIKTLAPDIIVDASGPFQTMGQRPYRVAEAALRVGAHYLDLCDDAAFTAGIKMLHDRALAAELVMISGASSVPAISSAACDALCVGMKNIHLIEATILPGNRAPRGAAVMASILHQVGQPMHVWRGHHWRKERAWRLEKRETLATQKSRRPINRTANLIGAPDLVLFPERYGAASVLFRAGLELGLLHKGLSIIGWLRRWHLWPPVRWTIMPLKVMADLVKGFGEDRGGMIVRVIGEVEEDRLEKASWTLIAEAGDGPHIPAIPAWVLIQKLRHGALKSGARPCLGAFDLAELGHGLAPLNVSSEVCREKFTPLFETVLKTGWAKLPPSLKELHTVAETRQWRGEASIARGKTLLSTLIAVIAGFPASANSCPVHVEMVRTKTGEIWRRRFGRSSFRSYLSARKGVPSILCERFGVMRFDIALEVNAGQLHFPVQRGFVLGVPLPSFILPRSKTKEYIDKLGRVCFDVAINMPLAGDIVHYKGWLKPVEPNQ